MDRDDDLHERALRRFDECVLAQAQMRAESLAARRFMAVPGAQWEGPWGEAFENGIRVEIPKIGRAVRKIETDYRENRIAPDFRPAGGDSDQDTADTLDGLHRADSYHFKASQARDNAVMEAIRGGFGAYRLANELADPYDKDSDAQRINPGLLIADADQCVYFDPQSRQYDKSDARYAFVVVSYTPDAYEEEFEQEPNADLPAVGFHSQFEWFRPDVVTVAEYYERVDVSEQLHILTQTLTGEEERYWASEIDAADLTDQQAKGWALRTTRRKRCRVMKSVIDGSEVLEDRRAIAGDCIPIVPVYGQREFVDGMERFKGHVQDRMDAQRLYNSNVSKLAETNARAPNEVPIFAAEQMPPNLAALWARANIDRSPYLLVNPLLNEDGSIAAAGPIGTLSPPQLAPVTATLLQISGNDLIEEDRDGADTVRANVSAEAMDVAAARVDAKSGIYLDNIRQSFQREGEIYLAMVREVYFEPGRTVDTMTEDGDDGTAKLEEAFTDPNTGAFKVRNDLTRGKYKVVASVSETTATRRDKTVRSALNTAEVALKAGDNELAQAAVLTAVMNQDGEGIADLHAFARKRALAIGLVQPNEEEQAEAERAAQSQQPDPVQAATADALKAQAAKDASTAQQAGAKIEETQSKTALNKAKVFETLADAHAKGMEARTDRMDALPGLPSINLAANAPLQFQGAQAA